MTFGGQTPGIELLIDPVHDAHGGDAVDFPGAGSVGEPIQGVEGGIAGAQLGLHRRIQPVQVGRHAEQGEPGHDEKKAHAHGRR